jgi:hypothetical protein
MAAAAMGTLLASHWGYASTTGTVTWTGGTSGSWGTAGNWGGTVTLPPISGDSLVFGTAGAGGTTLTDNLTTGSSFNIATLTFASGASSYTINPASSGTPGFAVVGLTSSGTFTGGGIINSAGTLETINDPLTVPYSTNITCSTNGTLQLGGVISGAGSCYVKARSSLPTTATPILVRIRLLERP